MTLGFFRDACSDTMLLLEPTLESEPLATEQKATSNYKITNQSVIGGVPQEEGTTRSRIVGGLFGASIVIFTILVYHCLKKIGKVCSKSQEKVDENDISSED